MTKKATNTAKQKEAKTTAKKAVKPKAVKAAAKKTDKTAISAKAKTTTKAAAKTAVKTKKTAAKTTRTVKSTSINKNNLMIQHLFKLQGLYRTPEGKTLKVVVSEVYNLRCFEIVDGKMVGPMIKIHPTSDLAKSLVEVTN
ncbi:MAG: hypothetical protein JW864_07085 [Spirochaetes bacterium]|nr:hypothetical protein [Spirochaetota bacterium]